MTFVDTNIVLRWLLGDHKELSVQAERIVSSARAGTLLVTDIVVAEVVYVLRSTGRDRTQTSEALLLIGRTEAFKYENEELITNVIQLITETSLDFADCYLLVRSQRENKDLATFDKQLKRRYDK